MEEDEYSQLQLESQKLQNKVDKIKTLGLLSQTHNLTPPNSEYEDPSRDIALVNSLSSAPRIQAIYLEIRGLELDAKGKNYIQVVKPIMNVDGAYRFCKVFKTLAQETEWASFSEEEINSRIVFYFEENYPYFTFNHIKFELDPMDFFYIATTMQIIIDASFHKAKSGKYINTLGRTYDEGTIRRALETNSPNSQNKKDNGFLSKYNPFRNN